MHPGRSVAALFETDRHRAMELDSSDVARLQRFFELNPGYFFAVGGQPPTPSEGEEEIHGALPDGWPYTRKWIIGFEDDAGSMIGMANIVSDLLAPRVWHIGLFMVATGLHGSGAAYALYRHLEHWAFDLGARWLRLGVVEGNTRAERFWERCAFVDVRKRDAVAMGKRINTLRVMAKPLAGGTLDKYLALVARDRPESC
jgi:RimJ/RimL family protein N-acetyltransferase